MKKFLTTAFLFCLFFNLGFSQEDPIGQDDPQEEPWGECIPWCTYGNSGTYGGYLGTNDHLPLIFRTDAIERMRITEAGEVGIGLNSPQSQLDVATSIRASDPYSYNYLELHADNSAASIFAVGDFSTWNTGDQNFISGQDFNVFTPASSTPALTILGSNGRVGIGTNTPTEELEVFGNIKFGINLSGVNTTERTTFSYDTPFTGAYVRLYGENHSSTPGRMSLVANSRNGGGEISFLDYDGASYHESMVIKADGNVGIGTNTPTHKLAVQGNGWFHGKGLFNTQFDHGTLNASGSTDLYPTSNADASLRFRPMSPTNTNESRHLIYDDQMDDALVIAPGADNGLMTNNKSMLKVVGDDVQVQIGNETITSGSHTDFRLAVNGKLLVKDALIITPNNWADFVFDDDYELMSLEQTEMFIKENHHLPSMPSAERAIEDGVDLEELNIKLLQQVEELTLHLIALNKEVAALKAAAQE